MIEPRSEGPNVPTSLHPMTRRQFLTTTAAAGAALAFPKQPIAAPVSTRFPLITFTKPFQHLSFDATAALVAEVGWDGIECPVRKGGQIEPERVEEDLPRMRDALKKRGLELALLTTDIRNATAPLTEKVLRTASELGVHRYRLTSLHYDLTKPIPPQLASLKDELRDLAALNKKLGLSGGIQNHSGRDYIGAPIWDIYELVHDLDPEHLGTCFDIGHATLEGGTSWPIEAKLMEPYFTCVYVKDFAWKNTARGWEAQWGPLGEGLVRREFFDWLKQSSYIGPISQHCEYLTGAGPEQVALMKKDCARLKEWLGQK